jgi:hypothetical protein
MGHRITIMMIGLSLGALFATSSVRAERTSTAISAAIDQAFKHNDARVLKGFLSLHSKIFMEAAPFGIGRAQLSATQCLQQLQSIFGKVKTLKFTIVTGGKDHERAEWSVRHKSTGRVDNYSVYVALKGRGDKIKIDSIRITRVPRPKAKIP